MADWKLEVLKNLVITEEIVHYVIEKYGNNWLLDNDVSDEILDDILKREFKKQHRVKDKKGKKVLKDDKATGTEIIHVVDKENDNVEVVLNKPKNKNLKEKEVIILDLDTGTYSLKRSSFSDSPRSTHPFKKFVNKVTSKSVLKGKHGTSSVSYKGRKVQMLMGTVFRGKPGISSVYSKVSLNDVVEAEKPPPMRNCILGLHL
ncbi:hypothetical protein Tco_0030777 [Tanacetum coccineum]